MYLLVWTKTPPVPIHISTGKSVQKILSQCILEIFDFRKPSKSLDLDGYLFTIFFRTNHHVFLGSKVNENLPLANRHNIRACLRFGA